MTCLRKVMRMTESKRIFTVTHGDRSYILYADPWTTLDLAWASQKCWFMPGSVVTITDENNNSKTFEKE